MKTIFTRIISSILIVSTLSMSLFVSQAQATLITSDQFVNSQTAQENRERVRAFFDREDVQTQLQARGVDSADAKARVDALTDGEVASINEQIDSLPAGGTDILGFFLLIFVILLITDILGLTRVFPFTRR